MDVDTTESSVASGEVKSAGFEPALLSIVVPVFNEEQNVGRLIEVLKPATAKLAPDRVEIVLVDDGSTDKTFSLALALCEEHAEIKVLKLSRNFGSHAAVMAGLCESTGDCVVWMAGDLQDPPALLPEMLDKWRQGHKIVWAARREAERITSSFYWILANWITANKLPAGCVDFALMDRQVIEVLRPQAHRDTCIFLQIAESGFTSSEVRYTKSPRAAGKSKWTLARKVGLVLKALLFSTKPLRLLMAVGFVCLLAGMVASIVAIALSVHKVALLVSYILVAVLAHATGAVLMAMILFAAEHLHVSGQNAMSVSRFVVEKRAPQ